jgi:hypothetical protein
MPRTIVEIVQAVCADYDRREAAIKYSAISGPVLKTYVDMNAAIEKALTCVEAGIRYELLYDIGRRTGYDVSTLADRMAKGTYYQRKGQVISAIARALALI